MPQIFTANRPVIAVVHAGPLPGTPAGGVSLGELAKIVAKESSQYRDGGVHGIILENMHDVPYLRGGVGPEITAAMADQFLTRMFRSNPDFVFTVTRDFVKSCQTPVLVLPDDTAGHSLTVAIESAMLAPKGQLSMYPWKDTPEKMPLAVRHVRSFLLSNRPT